MNFIKIEIKELWRFVFSAIFCSINFTSDKIKFDNFKYMDWGSGYDLNLLIVIG